MKMKYFSLLGTMYAVKENYARNRSPYLWLSLFLILSGCFLNVNLCVPYIVSFLGLIVGQFFASNEDLKYLCILMDKKGMKNTYLCLSLFLIYIYWMVGRSGTPVENSISILCFGLAALIPSILIDFRVCELPDSCTFMFSIAVFIALMLNGGIGNIMARSGFALISILVYAALSIFSLGFGWGDVKLMIPISFLTFNLVHLTNFWMAALIPAIVYAIGFAALHKEEFKKSGLKLKFAFGPFIIIGLLIILI